MAEKWRGTKESLDDSEGEWKSQLKIQYQKKKNKTKTKIMASGPITSWHIEEEHMEQWQTSFSWALKSLWMVTEAMTLEDDCFLAGKLWKT